MRDLWIRQQKIMKEMVKIKRLFTVQARTFFDEKGTVMSLFKLRATQKQ